MIEYLGKDNNKRNEGKMNETVEKTTFRKETNIQDLIFIIR